MPNIRDVKVTQIEEVGTIPIPPVRSIFSGPPIAIPQEPPVTVTIGTPIVNVPGCVEYNPNNAKNDPNGNVVLCDGQTPSFNPLDYDPSELILTGPPEPIPSYKGEIPEPPQIKETPIKNPQPTVPIVTAEEEKEEAIEIVEEPTFVEQYLPSAEEVTTTVTIAVAAATAAVFGKPLAELILKLIKPLVKKVVKKAQDKIGIKAEVLSVAERRQLQRDLRK